MWESVPTDELSQHMFPAGSSPHLAGGSSEALRAFTQEALQQGVTAAAVPTRTASTAVPLNLAVPAHEPRLADALVASGRLLEPRNGCDR